MPNEIRMEGLDKLQKNLQKLAGGREPKFLMNKALKQGAKIVEPVAEQLAPERTGALKQAIKVRTGNGRGSQSAYMVAIGKGWFKGKTWYAGAIEFGWKTPSRKARAAGATPVEHAGEHFMEYAFDETYTAAAKAITDSATKQVIDVLKGKGISAE